MLNGWYGLDTPEGWSAIGGQTISAWGPHCPVGSSSAGSAVAVSAGFAPVSLGVESCGSIVSASGGSECVELMLDKAVPASLAGIYAMKPSLGLLETSGIMPIRQVITTPTLPVV